MKKAILIILTISMSFISLSQEKEEDKNKQAVLEFISMINAKETSIQKALDKFGSKDLESGFFAYESIKDGKIVSSKEDCYNVEFKKGPRTYLYIFCLTNEKVISIKEKGVVLGK